MDQLLNSLNQRIRTCTDCGLAVTRQHAICGEGDRLSGVMLIAQAPGNVEDKSGRMFVGPSGKILNDLLKSAGIRRDEVYMTNMIKCYIPKCRRPSKNEIEQCTKHLENEIGIVKPKIIVPLGFHATRYLFNKNQLNLPASKQYHTLFGKLFTSTGYIILPLRHPTALLFNPQKRLQMLDNYSRLRNLIDKEKPEISS